MPDIEGILQGYIDLEKRETQDNKGRFKVVHNTSESCFSKYILNTQSNGIFPLISHIRCTHLSNIHSCGASLIWSKRQFA